MITEAPALWAFEEDILSRSWLEWLTAHTSFLKPLHRYQGVLSIYANAMQLLGKDKRTNNEFSLEIYKYEIEQLYLGFDKTFNPLETRGLWSWLASTEINFCKRGTN